jgi:hypothetical protein
VEVVAEVAEVAVAEVAVAVAAVAVAVVITKHVNNKMKYFTLHPLITHSIPTSIGANQVELKNLFETRKLNLKKDRSQYLQIGNDISPENIASELLDSPENSWLIYHVNNIKSRTDWPITNEENIRKLEKKYENQTTYFIKTLPALEVNDIVVLTSNLHTDGTTFNKLGIVMEWNSYLRFFRTLHSNGLSFSVNDSVTFIRKENSDYKILNFYNTGNTQAEGLTYSVAIQRKENPLNIPFQFKIAGNVISAYKNWNSNPIGNTYINPETLGISGPNGFTFTTLFGYMSNQSNIIIDTVKDFIKSKEIVEIAIPKYSIEDTTTSIKQAFLDSNHTATIEI